MSKKKHQTCFYCDRVYTVSGTAIGDHFPIPKRHGGTSCVPCCVQCHSIKDRMCVGDWNLEMMSKVIQDFPKLSCESRIFLAKCMFIVQDIEPTLTPDPQC